MKKYIALLLCLMLALSCAAFSACSSAPAAEEAPAEEAAAEETPAEEAAAEEAPAEEGTDVIELPVTIENKTGVDIYELYASGQNLEDWGDDLLGTDSYLPDGNSIDSVFVIDSTSLLWDLMMKDSDGNAVELYGLDFSNCSTDGGTIVLEYDSTTSTGTATLMSN